MLERVETMFDNMDGMMNKLKKKSYEQNMEGFLEKNRHYFAEMEEYLETQGDGAAKELAGIFTAAVKRRFENGGKIKGRVQADMNMFVIYYVFPAMLKTMGEQAVPMADALQTEWNTAFHGNNIGYTDYDTLYNSFNEKIFGIF